MILIVYCSASSGKSKPTLCNVFNNKDRICYWSFSIMFRIIKYCFLLSLNIYKNIFYLFAHFSSCLINKFFHFCFVLKYSVVISVVMSVNIMHLLCAIINLIHISINSFASYFVSIQKDLLNFNYLKTYWGSHIRDPPRRTWTEEMFFFVKMPKREKSKVISSSGRSCVQLFKNCFVLNKCCH